MKFKGRTRGARVEDFFLQLRPLLQRAGKIRVSIFRGVSRLSDGKRVVEEPNGSVTIIIEIDGGAHDRDLK